MRILVVTNFYPPHSIGGMEKRCKETVDSLRQRGYHIEVLTSRYGSAQPQTADGVHRMLHLEAPLDYYRPLDFFWRSRQQTAHNLTCVQQVLRDFQPDLVFIWGMWNLSKSIAAYLEEEWTGPLLYSLANDWPILPDMHNRYWQDAPNRPWLKPLKWSVQQLMSGRLRQIKREQSNLKLDNAIVVSDALRDRLQKDGVTFDRVRTIYPGIDAAPFADVAREPAERVASAAIDLLFVGSLVRHKGAHTGLHALSILRQQSNLRFRLSVVGAGHPDYDAHLHELVDSLDLDDSVHFVGSVPRDDIPALMHAHDILLFPSIWEEPFSRTVLEGMAAGMVVVGTTTGGTAEILVDGQTGLTFPVEDAACLAEKILAIANDPGRWEAIIETAAPLVQQEFSIERMIDEIEEEIITVSENDGVLLSS